MGQAVTQARRPDMWSIEEERPSRKALRFGSHRIFIDEIAGVSIEEIRERPVAGLVMGGATFLAFAMALAYLVFEGDFRVRFMIGTVFLAALAMASLREATQLQPLSLYQMTLTLKDGRRVNFSSADRADIQALGLRILHEQAQDRTA